MLKRFNQRQKLNNAKNSSNGPWDLIRNDMGTHLEKLGETNGWIFKVKKVLQVFENYT